MVNTTMPATNTRHNDIFISYSRRDKTFIQKLDAAFRQLNRDPWIDWDDIREAEAWRSAIAQGIVAADTFIFVISPDSVASIECGKELMQAIEHNKRIIPIVYREATNVHPVIAELNWIFFRETDHFDTAFQKLLQAINTDLQHVRMHTRLLGRANEWEHGRDDSFLLRGKDLATAEVWLADAVHKKPLPTELQKLYISKSREVEAASLRLAEAGLKAKRIIRISLGISFATLLGSLITTAIVTHNTNQKVIALNTEQVRLESEILKQEAKIANLNAVQRQLSEERQILITALKEFGWTEAHINHLLASNSQSEITNAVNQSVQANAIYQDAIDQHTAGQSEINTSDNQTSLLPPSTSTPQKNGITVEYYPQDIDPATVQRALSKLGFTLKVKEPNQPNLPINTIFYSPDVNPESIKLVAYCLIRAGIEIKSIQPFADTDRTATIQVGTQPDADKKPLTVKQIRSSNLPLS